MRGPSDFFRSGGTAEYYRPDYGDGKRGDRWNSPNKGSPERRNRVVDAGCK